MSHQNKIDEAINQKKPKLIFLNGKTSTGKTTLSQSLQKKYACAVIELDDIVHSLEAPARTVKYIEAYLNRELTEFVQAFVSTTQKRIAESLANHSCVVIEGALTNTTTLQEIIAPWSDSFLFIYLHPKDVEMYKLRLLNRFKHSSKDNDNRLPMPFWEKFTPDQLDSYWQDRIVTPEIDKAITTYVEESTDVSETRLKKFSALFKDMLVVEV